MRKSLVVAALMLGSSVLLGGCNQVKQATDRIEQVGRGGEVKDTAHPERVYWGDTHLHTSNSLDAFGLGNRLGPEDTLRFATGQEVTSSSGVKARLARPLDFLVIADHAESMGSTKALYDTPRAQISDAQLLRWHDLMHQGLDGSAQAVAEMSMAKAEGKLHPAIANPSEESTRKIWNSHIATVERYNSPGTFTAFLGFEYGLVVGSKNLHRNVIFRDGGDKVGKVLPLGAWGPNASAEEIWDYMDAYEKATGGKALAIPHNGNLSNGLMFEMTLPGGGPMTASYAKRRAAREPVIEITQMKGDGESHPFLSPNDEFAGFSYKGWDLGDLDVVEKKRPGMFAGEYAREALKRGLLLEAQSGVNPYKFGVVGSTDSHTSLPTIEEDNYFGKHPGAEPSPKRATEEFVKGAHNGRMTWQTLASGYAAVWATSNTRAAIWDAMMRREVYGTTGPRMIVRFFGGWDFKAEDLNGDWVKAGYARGVPMGGELKSGTGKPSFLISVLKDPIGANLDRVQVIKGWTDNAGKAHEQVYDVVWSSPETRKPAGGKLPAVGDTVDTATATYKNSIGAPSLATVWTDPQFDPAQRAFYYVRVLEIPTPTWLAYDALRFNLKLGPEMPLKQQERGYTSAIWYTPGG